ncbi:MAG TPA: 3-hydroxybutyryl-CoA dehydratase [Methylomirabilota bacterium]|nr:3-hydroxybutyryl-CoA dehydratase [Methylomirabilota bacterium]
MDLTAMRAIDLDQITKLIAGAPRPINVLWQTDDSIAFVARGREGRSEFHVDPSDDVMYMIKGDMNLHYRTEDGQEKVAVIREGEILHCPAGTPHSPRFAPDSYVLVLERKRRAAEADRFLWYCPACGAQLYEAVRQVADWRDDPVSEVYADFYSAESHRTCGKCGHVTPRPAPRP